MDHFYVTLPSDSSAKYFPNNTIANFRTKLTMPIELEHNEWEVGLVEISYPDGYRKKRIRQNTLRIDNTNIKFSVKHYESMYDLASQLSEHYKKTTKRNEFMTAFDKALQPYFVPDKVLTEAPSSDYGANSVQLEDSIVAYFPVRTYNGFEDLFTTIMKPTNHSSSRVIISTKDNTDFTLPEPVYVYTDVIKPNFVGDSCVRLLTSLHFPSNTGYHRFDYPLYKPVEPSIFETIEIRLVTKTGEDVFFDDSAIPCLVVLHFKKRSSMK